MYTVIYVIDRIEGEIAVCIPDSGYGHETLDLPAELAGGREGDAVAVTFEDTEEGTRICQVRPATMEEHRSKTAENVDRLHRLFHRSNGGNQK